MKQNYFLGRFMATLTILFGTIGWSQDVYDYTGSLQYYVVPDDVYRVEIEATGAEGGNGSEANSGVAGRGARMIGSFDVTPGETLVLLVGEQGEGAQYVGGGGGGSFVWKETGTELLIAAGGGGGGGATDASEDFRDGMNASIDESGTNGNGIPDGAGVDGEGGTTPTITNWASAGAGWASNGNNGSTHGCTYNSMGGQAIPDGAAGGAGGGSDVSAADGGYGGGGGGNARCGAVGGGGGGGYSGGGAGGELVILEYNGGGGGGSFNAGEDQDNTAGVGTGNGQIIITGICNPIEITYTTVEETLPGNGAIDITVTGGSGSFTFDWDTDEADDFDDSEDLIGLTAGTYTVIVRDESICDDVEEMIDVISVIGLDEESTNVSIFPNPAKDIFNVQLNGEFNYTLFAIDGTRIVTNYAVNTAQVDVSNLEHGVYFIEVNNAAGSRVIQVVVQ